jgi:hypothetical protein
MDFFDGVFALGMKAGIPGSSSNVAVEASPLKNPVLIRRARATALVSA